MITTTASCDPNGVILAFEAHSDDLAIGCGGLLLQLKSAGKHVLCYTLTGNDDRIAEARHAADWLGMQFVDCTRYQDARLPNHWDQLLDQFADTKRDLQSQGKSIAAVLCPSKDDRHQDHRVIAENVWRVFRDHLILEYEVPSFDGAIRDQTAFVKLTSFEADEKVKMLMECFPSRVVHPWWREATFRSLMCLRGIQVNAEYAESFTVRRQVLKFDHPAPGIGQRTRV
jgi:LmbE family N-acetylglucosaminyl deacetylase